MLPLSDLQRAFRLAVFDDDPHARDTLAAMIVSGEPGADARIDIYRNNTFASLSDVLKETFPAVCRLVDERFFAYAAQEFIRTHPPRRPCLVEYGQDFPDFLARFPPCRDLHYLPDTARFEWLLNMAAHARDSGRASIEALSVIAPAQAARLVFEFDSSFGYLTSPFPIDAIWRANRFSTDREDWIDLGSGEVCLEVSREGDEVVFRKLDRPAFRFRQALHGGASLGEALEQAFRADPDFSAADALMSLFAQGAIAALSLPSAAVEATS